jgi:hypothetical protein
MLFYQNVIAFPPKVVKICLIFSNQLSNQQINLLSKQIKQTKHCQQKFPIRAINQNIFYFQAKSHLTRNKVNAMRNFCFPAHFAFRIR